MNQRSYRTDGVDSPLSGFFQQFFPQFNKKLQCVTYSERIDRFYLFEMFIIRYYMSRSAVIGAEEKGNIIRITGICRQMIKYDSVPL